MYMEELFMVPISRVGFLIAWLYIETVYMAFTILLGSIPLWVNVPAIVITGISYFVYALRFLLILGIVVRRIRDAGLPGFLSFAVIFPYLQGLIIFVLSFYPGKYEPWIPNFKKEFEKFNIETILFGGYGL